MVASARLDETEISSILKLNVSMMKQHYKKKQKIYFTFP